MTVTLVITDRTGATRSIEVSRFAASLIVLSPPDDAARIIVIGGCDDFVRSHVPFVPYTERPGSQRGREYADVN